MRRRLADGEHSTIFYLGSCHHQIDMERDDVQPNQGAAAHRRPAGQSGGSENLSATVAAARALPAAVAELGRRRPKRISQNMNITRAAEARHREFNGVSFELLAIGEQSMVTKMKYRQGNYVPFHAHPNEQSGYILSGRYRLLTRDSEVLLFPGDSYSIPSGVEHRMEILEPGDELTVFTPPREDYR